MMQEASLPDDLDPDLLLAMALSIPLMEKAQQPEHAVPYQSSLSHLLTMLHARSEKSSSGKLFNSKVYFERLLHDLSRKKFLDSPDSSLQRTIVVYNAVLEAALTLSLPLDVICFLTATNLEILETLLAHDQGTAAFSLLKNTPALDSFYENIILFSVHMMDFALRSKECFAGVERSVIEEMRKAFIKTICTCISPGKYDSISNLEKYLRSVPLLPDALFRNIPEPEEAPDQQESIFARFKSSAEFLGPGDTSSCNKLIASWKKKNATYFFTAAGGITRFLESFLFSFRSQATAPIESDKHVYGELKDLEECIKVFIKEKIFLSPPVAKILVLLAIELSHSLLDVWFHRITKELKMIRVELVYDNPLGANHSLLIHKLVAFIRSLHPSAADCFVVQLAVKTCQFLCISYPEALEPSYSNRLKEDFILSALRDCGIFDFSFPCLLFLHNLPNSSHSPDTNFLGGIHYFGSYSKQDILSFLFSSVPFLELASGILVAASRQKSYSCLSKDKEEEEEEDSDDEWSEDADEEFNWLLGEIFNITGLLNSLLTVPFSKGGRNWKYLEKSVPVTIEALLFLTQLYSPNTQWIICLDKKGSQVEAISSSAEDPNVPSLSINLLPVETKFRECITTIHLLFSHLFRSSLSEMVGHKIMECIGVIGGGEEKKWPLWIPIHHLIFVSKYLFFSLVSSSPSQRNTIIMDIWTSTLRSLYNSVTTASSLTTELISPEHMNLLLNLYHLLSPSNRKVILMKTGALLAVPTTRCIFPPRYFLAMSRIITLVLYFLFHFDKVEKSVSRNLEIFLLDRDLSTEKVLRYCTTRAPPLPGASPSPSPSFYYACPLPSTDGPSMHPEAASILLESEKPEAYHARYLHILQFLQYSLCELNEREASIGSHIHANFFGATWDLLTRIPPILSLWNHMDAKEGKPLNFPKDNTIFLYLFWFTQIVLEEKKISGKALMVGSSSLPFYFQDFVRLLASISNPSPSFFKTPALHACLCTIIQYNVPLSQGDNGPGKLSLAFITSHIDPLKNALITSIAHYRTLFAQERDRVFAEKIGDTNNLLLPLLRTIPFTFLSEIKGDSPILQKVRSLSMEGWEQKQMQEGNFQQFQNMNLSPSHAIEHIISTLQSIPISKEEHSKFGETILFCINSAFATLHTLFRSCAIRFSPNDLDTLLSVQDYIREEYFDDFLDRAGLEASAEKNRNKTQQILVFITFFLTSSCNESLPEGMDKYEVFEKVLEASIGVLSLLSKNGNSLPFASLFHLLFSNTSHRIEGALHMVIHNQIKRNNRFLREDTNQAIFASFSPEFLCSWAQRIFLEDSVGHSNEEIPAGAFLDQDLATGFSSTSTNDKGGLNINMNRKLLLAMSEEKTLGAMLFQSLLDIFPRTLHLNKALFSQYYFLLKKLSGEENVLQFIKASVSAGTLPVSNALPSAWEYANRLLVFSVLQKHFKPMEDGSLCSSVEQEGKFKKQHWYYCYSCEYTFDKGICATCLIHCHSECEVSYARYSSFLCDCASHPDVLCEAQKPDIPSNNPLSLLLTKQDEIEQNWISHLIREYSAPPANQHIIVEYDTIQIGDAISLSKRKSKFLQCLSDISGNGFLAVIREDSLVLAAIPYFFHPRHDADQISFYTIESTSLSFTPFTLAFHPLQSNFLAVAGPRHCSVLKLDECGHLQLKIDINMSSQVPGTEDRSILQILWLPGSLTQLLLVYDSTMELFDLSIDASTPVSQFTLEKGKIRFVAIHASFRALFIATSNGLMYQTMLHLIPHMPLTHVIEVPKKELYSGSIRSLFFDVFSSRLFLSFLSGTTVVGSFHLPTSSFEESFTCPFSADEWKAIPSAPNVFLTRSQSKYLSIILVDKEQLFFETLPHSIIDFAVVPFLNETNCNPNHIMAISMEKHSHLSGISITQSLQCMKATGKRIQSKHSIEMKQDEDTAADASLLFATMECITESITFSGDLLSYYTEAEIKEKVLSNSKYLVSLSSSCSITIHSDDPTKMISGLRILVGHSSIEFMPDKFKIEDAEESTNGNRQWIEFLFPLEQQFLSPYEVTIKAKAYESDKMVIDSIQVYAIPRETVLCADPLPLTIYPQTPREKVLAEATLSLSFFYQLKPATSAPQWILPLLNNSVFTPYHSALTKLTCAVYPKEEAVYHVFKAQLDSISKIQSATHFFHFTGLLHTMYVCHGSLLSEFLGKQEDFVSQLLSLFYLHSASFSFMQRRTVVAFITKIISLIPSPLFMWKAFKELLHNQTEASHVRMFACDAMIQEIRAKPTSTRPCKLCNFCFKVITKGFSCSDCEEFDLCATCREVPIPPSCGHTLSHKMTPIEQEDVVMDGDDEDELQMALRLSMEVDHLPSIFLLQPEANAPLAATLSYLKVLQEFLAKENSSLVALAHPFTVLGEVKFESVAEKEKTILFFGFLSLLLRKAPWFVFTLALEEILAPLFSLVVRYVEKESRATADSAGTIQSRSEEKLLLLPSTTPICRPGHYFYPLLTIEQCNRCPNGELRNLEDLLLENALRLLCAIHESFQSETPLVSMPSPFTRHAWEPVLFSLLRQKKSDSPLRSLAKTLLHGATGSADEYYRHKDEQLFTSSKERIVALSISSNQFTTELSNNEAGTLILQLKRLYKQISKDEKRAASWQQFLMKHNELLVALWQGLPFLYEESIQLILKLICLALQAAQQSNDVKQLFSLLTSPWEHFERYISLFLLEKTASTIRNEFGILLHHMWKIGDDSHKESLITILRRVLTILPSFGIFGKEFFEFLEKIFSSRQRSAAEQLLQPFLLTLQAQNNILLSHPNSYVYRDLQSFIEFEGFYFEKEPCFVCNTKSLPYQDQSMPSIAMKENIAYSANSITMKLTNALTIKKIQVNIQHDGMAQARRVKTIQLFYNNKPSVSSTLAELRDQTSFWKLANTATLSKSQRTADIEFVVPITMQYIMIVYAELVEDEQTKSKEKLHCPRCNQIHTGSGITCTRCKEVIFQCAKCSLIDYESGFLCSGCGYCKYANFSFLFTAKPSFVCASIDNEEEHEKAMKIIDTESQNCHELYQKVQRHQACIVTLLSRHKGKVSSSNHHPSSLREAEGSRHSLARLISSRVHNRSQLSNPNAAMTSVVSLYNVDCKKMFVSLCKSISILLSTRDELARFHSKTAKQISPTLATSNCFTCSNAFVSLSLSFLGSLMEQQSSREAILKFQGISVIYSSSPLPSPSSSSILNNVPILCRLVRNLPEASKTLNQLLEQKLHAAIESSNSLTFATFPHHAMELLCTTTILSDSEWPHRLKVVLSLLKESLPKGLDHPILNEHIILPALRVLTRLCNVKVRCTSAPSISMDQFHEKGSSAFHDWKQTNSELFLCPSVENKKIRWPLLREIIARWKKMANIPHETKEKPNKDDQWLFSILLTSTSLSVRKEVAALLGKLCGEPYRNLQLLIQCRTKLGCAVAHEEKSNEFFSIFDTLLRMEGHLAFLTQHGFLEELTALIYQQVAMIYKQECQQTLKVRQGFLLHKLVMLLEPFLLVNGICRYFKQKDLIEPLLESYVSLRKVVRQNTTFIQSTGAKLIELLTSLNNGSQEDDHDKFIMACIKSLGECGTDRRTPLFIIEQLNGLVCPEKQESERFLNLRKTRTQEEFISGSIQNPVACKECGLRMRDVKNKICRDLMSLRSFLDEDNGVELLVCNKIISLDLPIKEVYEQIWIVENQFSLDTHRPMDVTFRVQGLDGEATEELVEVLSQSSDEEKDPEEEFKVTATIARCCGLEILCSWVSKLEYSGKDVYLVSQVLRLLSYCSKLKENRIRLLKAHAIPLFLEKLKLVFPQESLLEIAQQLLGLVEVIVEEASNEESANTFPMNDAAAIEKATEQMKLFLSKLDPTLVKYNPQLVESITHVLPVLTYGYDDVAHILSSFFTSTWHTKPKKENIKVQWLANVARSIKEDANGKLLRSVFLQCGITDQLFSFLHNILPEEKESNSEEWSASLEEFGIGAALHSLTGLVCHFADAQNQVFHYPSLLKRLQQLSTIASKQKLGNSAELLLEALKHTNEQVKASLDKLHQERKVLHEKKAAEHREKVLQEMKKISLPQPSTQEASLSSFFDFSELDDDEEFGCVVCKEGFQHLPLELLGFYVYSTRSIPFDVTDGTSYMNTVSNFHLIHHSCHKRAAEAEAKLSRPKREWEGACLRNGSALCNNFFPILGPNTPEEKYANGVEKYFQEFSANFLPGPLRIRNLVFDASSLCLRIVMESSFHEESHGGGLESNVRMFPFFVQLTIFLLDSSFNDRSHRKTLEKQMAHFLREDPSHKAAGEFAPFSNSYFLVLSLFILSPSEWIDWRFFFLKHIICSVQEDADAMDMEETPKIVWHHVKTPLRLLALIQKFHVILHGVQEDVPFRNMMSEENRKKISFSHDPAAEWISKLKSTLQHSGFEIADKLAAFSATLKESLFAVDSFVDFLSFMNIPFDSENQFIISLHNKE